MIHKKSNQLGTIKTPMAPYMETIYRQYDINRESTVYIGLTQRAFTRKEKPQRRVQYIHARRLTLTTRTRARDHPRRPARHKTHLSRERVRKGSVKATHGLSENLTQDTKYDTKWSQRCTTKGYLRGYTTTASGTYEVPQIARGTYSLFKDKNWYLPHRL